MVDVSVGSIDEGVSMSKQNAKTESDLTYWKLLGKARSEDELLTEEERQFNINNLKLSAALMGSWGVPSEYARPFVLRARIGEMGEVNESTLLEKSIALALTAGTLAAAIYSDGWQQASQNPQCINAVELLGFKNDVVANRVNSIESTWRLWLGLIAK